MVTGLPASAARKRTRLQRGGWGHAPGGLQPSEQSALQTRNKKKKSTEGNQVTNSQTAVRTGDRSHTTAPV